MLLATVSRYTRSWYRPLSTQPKLAQLHDTKHWSYIKSFFPVIKKPLVGYRFALPGFMGGCLACCLITDTALCWLKHHARSAGQCDRNVAHKRVCSVSVLCCRRRCHSLLGSHNKRLSGRYHCGPSTAPELLLISRPSMTPRELLLAVYLLDPQKSYWGCHNCVSWVTVIGSSHSTDEQ